MDRALSDLEDRDALVHALVEGSALLLFRVNFLCRWWTWRSAGHACGAFTLNWWLWQQASTFFQKHHSGCEEEPHTLLDLVGAFGEVIGETRCAGHA